MPSSAAHVRPVFRFAPSPTGPLHLGHARSALLNAAMAAKSGGRLLLRIEDIDPTRLLEEHVEAIYEDLAWLGLTWEQPVLRQSLALDVYREATSRLTAMGLLYPCFASRQDILAAGGDPAATDPDGAPLYPGLWRDRPATDVAAARAAGHPFALRLDMAKAKQLVNVPLSFRSFDDAGRVSEQTCDPARWGDVVLVRKETPTSYHLAVVVDDARQGVTHIVRGADLLAATDVHRLLQALLGLPVPLYHHHALITDARGRKLSKSAGDTSLRALRTAGVSPAQVRRMALAPHV